MKVSTQLCLTLCHPKDCSPPGISVHGILQARIPEWVAISFSRGSSRPRDQTHVSHIPMSPTLQADSLLTEPPEKPQAVKRALKTVKHVNYSDTTLTSADDKMSWFILLTFCDCPVNSKSRPLLSGGAETSWHLLYSLLIISIWSESRKKLMPWIDGHILYSSSLNTDCSYRDVFTHLQWKETLTIWES